MAKNKDLNHWTIKDFLKLPRRKWNEEIEDFDSLIILPKQDIQGLHDSGYRCMDFIAINNDTPICRLSGCSDVIHIEGIGGYGYKWFEKGKGVPNKVDSKAYSIDCLATSGLLRLFCDGYKLKCGEALSSFELFTIKK